MLQSLFNNVKKRIENTMFDLAMNSEKLSYDNELGYSYYYEAFNKDVRTLWNGINFVRYNENVIKNICYYKALKCFLDTNETAINERRILLFNFLAKGEYSKKKGATLDVHKGILPINSIVPRIMKLLCSAYNQTPARKFKDASFEVDILNLYEQGKVNSVLQDAYKYAKLCGLVAIRPVFIEGEFRLIFFTPDEFRIIPKETDYLTPNNFIHVDYDPFTGEIRYRNWTETELITLNEKGETISIEPHNYGKIPFVFLKLSHAKTFYNSGLMDLIESQLNINRIRFGADLDAAYNANSIKIGTNLGEANQIDLSPGKLISINGIRQTEDSLLPPALDFVAPPAQYDQIDGFAQTREAKLYRDLGFPSSMIGEQSGAANAYTGIARIIDRQEIIESRYADINFLNDFEKKLAQMIITVANADAFKNWNIEIDFSIDFGEERIYLEPGIEYEFDKKKMQDGIISPIEFYKKWSGDNTSIEDAELIQILQERKELNKQLFSTQSTIDNGNTNNAERSGIDGNGAGLQTSEQTGFERANANGIDKQSGNI